MKYLFLVLIVFISCSRIADMKTKYAYEEYVEVTEGFYRGSKGKIMGVRCTKGEYDKCEQVVYEVFYDSMKSEWHNEEQLSKATKKDLLATTNRCYKKKKKENYNSVDMFEEVDCNEKAVEETSSDIQ